MVGALGSLVQAQGNPGLSLLATGLIAVLFQPLRSRLQRGVNRLMFGERDDPYAALSQLGRRLGATLAPEAILPTLVETVARTLVRKSIVVAASHTEHASRMPPIVQLVSRDRHFPSFFVTA